MITLNVNVNVLGQLNKGDGTMDENLLTGDGFVECSPTSASTHAEKKATKKMYLFNVTFADHESMRQRAIESVSRLVATPARKGLLAKFAGASERIKVIVSLNAKGNVVAAIEGVDKQISPDVLIDQMDEKGLEKAAERIQARLEEIGWLEKDAQRKMDMDENLKERGLA